MAGQEGRCDPISCYTSDLGSYITCDENYCTFGGCNSNLMRIPATVPIKTTLSGLSQTPFVKLRFEGILKPEGGEASPADWDYTEITVGNISQPYGDIAPRSTPTCNAMIKSFQYSWGSIDSGNSCKLVIIDQQGSSVEKWFQRLFKNIHLDQVKTTQGVYKMKMQWGWVIVGENGECPADYAFTGPAYCIEQNFYGTVPPPITSIPTNNSSAPSRLICSPACWFLPDTLNVSYQGTKIIYEISGKDLLQRSSEQPLSFSYGYEATADNPVSGLEYFTDAVVELGKKSLPPFTVKNESTLANTSFKQINETTGMVEPMKFWVATNIAQDPDLATKGPKGVWQVNETTPFQAIRNWLNSGAVKADSDVEGSAGKGITMTFDPINRECIFWANSMPSCQANINIDQRLKAAYVYGGKCSPILSFTPTVKYDFLSNAAAGGISSPVTGRQSKMTDSNQNSNCFVQGRFPRVDVVPTDSAIDTMGAETAIIEVETATAAHLRATQLQYTIEAELRVQGDPSDFLCSPLFGYGQSIALIIPNPYYIVQEDDEFCGWSQLTDSSCNTIFTNPAWFILGADHQIKDGSYVTTYKLALFPGGNSEVAAKNALGNISTLGATLNIPDTFNPETFTVCNHGTFPCIETGAYPTGALEDGTFINQIDKGAHVFCLRECSTTGGVT